jgi:hypothetical protein
MTKRPTVAETKRLAEDHLIYEIAMVAGLARRLLSFREMLTHAEPNGDPQGRFASWRAARRVPKTASSAGITASVRLQLLFRVSRPALRADPRHAAGPLTRGAGRARV